MLFIGLAVWIIIFLGLFVYSLVSTKGSRYSNLLFTVMFLLLGLTLAKGFYGLLFPGLKNHYFSISLSASLFLGPVYYILIDSLLGQKFRFKNKTLLHFIIPLLLFLGWLFLEGIHINYKWWNIFHRSSMLLYISYLSAGIYRSNNNSDIPLKIKKQFNIMSCFLCAIWLSLLINEVSDLPYLAGSLIYLFFIFSFLKLIFNNGYFIDTKNEKYKKTGLGPEEKSRILLSLNKAFIDGKVYMDSNISLAKIAKIVQCTPHALSQAINEKHQKTYFEYIGEYRIEEAKRLLIQNPGIKISDIAYQVGYNSLSAFNTAFKKRSGSTPSNFRNENK